MFTVLFPQNVHKPTLFFLPFLVFLGGVKKFDIFEWKIKKLLRNFEGSKLGSMYARTWNDFLKLFEVFWELYEHF